MCPNTRHPDEEACSPAPCSHNADAMHAYPDGAHSFPTAGRHDYARHDRALNHCSLPGDCLNHPRHDRDEPKNRYYQDGLYPDGQTVRHRCVSPANRDDCLHCRHAGLSPHCPDAPSYFRGGYCSGRPKCPAPHDPSLCAEYSPAHARPTECPYAAHQQTEEVSKHIQAAKEVKIFSSNFS